MQLFREINIASSTFLVIGNIIGIGIFTISGLIVDLLGNSFWLIGVWLLGGALALIGAVCYSLLAARIPKAGGEYAFIYPAYGPLPAFLSGWASLLIGFSAPIAAAALGFSYYMQPFLPDGWSNSSIGVKTLAVIVLVSVCAFLSLGLKFGTHLHSFVTLLNLALILGFSFVILRRADVSANLTPILDRGLLDVDFSSLGSAIILVMFTYSGWNAAAYVAEEIRRPRRNIPSALIFGTLLVMAAYVLVNLAYYAAVPLPALAGQIEIAEITASRVLGAAGSSFVTVVILSSISSSLTAMSIAGPRIYFAMSRDRLFPDWLSHVDLKRKLPLRAIWFQTAIALALIITTDFREILVYSGVILVLFSTLTVSVLFWLQSNGQSALSFGFFYRLLPGVFVGINILILINAVVRHSGETLAGLLTVAAGVPVYWFYQQRKRRLRRLPDPELGSEETSVQL